MRTGEAYMGAKRVTTEILERVHQIEECYEHNLGPKEGIRAGQDLRKCLHSYELLFRDLEKDSKRLSLIQRSWSKMGTGVTSVDWETFIQALETLENADNK